MNNDFKVLLENTFKFKEGKLYLMLLHDNGAYAIEVVDRYKTFGRKYSNNRKEAELLFNTVINKLAPIKTLITAESLIKDSFGRTEIREIIFLLSLEDRNISQKEIGKLVIALKIKVKAKQNYLCAKRKKGAITIYVFFDIKKKAIGRFFGTRFSDDFKFEKLN